VHLTAHIRRSHPAAAAAWHPQGERVRHRLAGLVEALK
jgi:hypothetical protein